jgi:hypothetical protein
MRFLWHVRVASDWNPTIPHAADGFPDHVAGGFGLLPGEALWLAEQTTKTAEDTLLAHLLATEQVPDPESSAPWADQDQLGGFWEVATPANRVDPGPTGLKVSL